MLYKPTIGDQLSGSIGGITASRNRSGGYFRRRGLPVNPGTPQQEFVRGTMADLASRWREVLTPAERDGWDSYAAATPMPNRIGDSHEVNGLAMYVRGNLARIQAGFLRIDAAPIESGLPPLTVPSIEDVDATAGTADIGFESGDGWANEVGGALLVYASRPKAPSINFFKGPYRLSGSIAGAGIAPSSPATLTLPFSVQIGQRVFFRFVAVTADGRATDPIRDFRLAT